MNRTLSAIGALTLAAMNTLAHAGPVERLQLDNGMRVILRPIEGAQSTALVTLFAVGERHDPSGFSGMAHLAEHLFVTAATDEKPARTAEEWAGAYPPPVGGSNAQTGEDYTVIATVFPNDRLDAELRDIASRMRGLRISQADFDRELPRMEIELGNMFGGMPPLAAMNHARESVRPSGDGFRKGGLVEQLRMVTVEQARRFVDACYKPRHAIVVIAGGFKPEQVRARIDELFAGIEAGVDLPPMSPRENRAGAGPETIRLERPEWYRGPSVIVTRAYPAPAPDSPLYAPFLVQVSRLLRASAGADRSSGVSPVWFTPLDDPHVLYLSATAEGPGQIDKAREAIDQRIELATTERAEKPADAPTASMQFGWMLGAQDLPDAMIAGNPYAVAFALLRAELMGIDWPAIEERLGVLTRQDMEAAAEAIFDNRRGAEVIVSVE